MKIELGGFGYSRPDVVAPAEKSQVSQAVGAAGLRISAAEEEAQRNREAFQRATAANSFAKYQLALEDVGRGIEEDMATGTLSWDQANAEYGKRAEKVQAPDVKLDSPIDRENQQTAVMHAQERTRQSLAPSIFQARQRAGAAQLDSFLDTQAKRAVEPGANVDQINASADAFGANARQYGLPENLISARVQNFKDANWYNAALQRAVDSDGNLPALKGVLHDITDPKGIYAGKLDPTKRATLQASVQNQIDRIELRAQAAGDRREARGERAVVQMERQISSGIPATPQMWAEGADITKGTTSEAAFNELAKTEQEVQETLRKPIGDQVRLVQEKEAALLQGGGTVAQGANVARLKNAVESNVKLLTQAPLVYGEERLGDQNIPLNVSDLLTPQGRANVGTIFNERAARVRALGKQFQAPIPMRPLLPQEAKQLSSMIESSSPTDGSALYGLLADAAGSPEVYRGMMQQIAPDAPVRAAAGLLAQKQRDLMIKSHWFSPDEYVASTDVAATILEGDRQLNKSSTAKAEDGKPQPKLVLPETKLLQEEFAKQVGTTYAGRPDAAAIDFQAVQAYYAGRIAQTGEIPKGTDDVNKNLVREAVRATIGNIVDINNRGDVAAPWGMAEDDFRDRVFTAIGKEAKRRGIEDPTTLNTTRAFIGLTNTPTDGVYAVKLGERFMRDDANQRVFIDLRPSAGVARGYIQRD